jgi:hypothetical protein
MLNLDDWCLRKSYADIAEALFATRPTLRRVMADLAEWGLISVSEKIYQTNGQGPNEHRLDWEGVRAWHGKLLQRQGVRIPPAHIEQPPAQCDHPPAHIEQSPAHIEQPYKEYISSGIPLLSFPPPPTPRKAAGEEEDGKSNFDPIDKPAPAGHAPAWLSIENRLRVLGLREVAIAIDSAKRARMPHQTFTDAIDFFEANRGAWGVGAVFYFVRGWREGLEAEEHALWPTPDESWAVRARRKAREIAEQGRAKHAPDHAIREVCAKNHCLWFLADALACEAFV